MKNPIGEKIAVLRGRRSVTQETLANYLHVTPQAVSRWENGQSYPDLETLPLLAVFFDVSIDELFSFERESYMSELVMRYSITRREEDFTPALEAVRRGTQAEDPKLQLRAYGELTHLYYQRCIEMLAKAEDACRTFIEKAETVDREAWLRGRAQMLLYRFMDRGCSSRELKESLRPDRLEAPTREDYFLYLTACREDHDEAEWTVWAERAVALFEPDLWLLETAAELAGGREDWEEVLRCAGAMEALSSKTPREQQEAQYTAAALRFKACERLGQPGEVRKALLAMGEHAPTAPEKELMRERLRAFDREQNITEGV